MESVHFKKKIHNNYRRNLFYFKLCNFRIVLDRAFHHNMHQVSTATFRKKLVHCTFSCDFDYRCALGNKLKN